MKLKCIGGLANGKIIEIDNCYGEHDLIRVQATIEFSIIDFEESLQAFRENRTPESMATRYHIYKIAVLHFSKHERIKFLIPETMKVQDVLCFVLGA